MGTQTDDEGGMFVVRQRADKDGWFHANDSTPLHTILSGLALALVGDMSIP